MNTATRTVGANIRAEMARRGITQAELAAALGIQQSPLSRRLRGLTPWEIDELAAAANALGVHIDTLLVGVRDD